MAGQRGSRGRKLQSLGKRVFGRWLGAFAANDGQAGGPVMGTFNGSGEGHAMRRAGNLIAGKPKTGNRGGG